MTDNYSIKQVAQELGIDPTTVRRLIEKVGPQLGIEVRKGRAATSNAKWSHFLTRDDADKLITYYRAKEAVTPDRPPTGEPVSEYGVFYIIQLVPEALPNRIKVGYTDNLEKRLAEHQTAAPTARVIGSWPCKRSWDYAAMDSVTRTGCAWVLNEVFEGDPQGFLDRAEAFFALMPRTSSERPLSEHSPLRSTV